MLTLNIKHPEALEFALIKQDLTKVTGANVSLLINDEFLKAVEEDKDFIQTFPIDARMELIMPRPDAKYNQLYEGITPGTYYKKVKAKELWDQIVAAAHKSAEPGLIFWDRQHYYSPSSIYPGYENISTNPCSEIAMGNDSCRLIAQNLFNFVEKPYTSGAYFNYDRFKAAVRLGMRLMDDLVDLELEAIEKILDKIKSDPEPDHIKQVEIETWEQLYKTGQRGRRTGLGITALGDTLAALGLPYSSEQSLKVVDQIFRSKLEAELEEMINMAKERGAFADFDATLELADADSNPDGYMAMIRREFPELWAEMQLYGRRNISWSTVAPTGSLSMLTKIGDGFGTTSGIEPLFNTEPLTCWYVRRKKINPNDRDARVDFIDELGDKWTHFRVFHEGFTQWAAVNRPGVDLQQLSTDELKALVAESPYGGSGSSEIKWEKRVELQGIIQKYISHSISSTINLPQDVPLEVVSNLYFKSWNYGLKGITIYRDGSRSGVLVSEASTQKKEDTINYNDAPKRPKQLQADIHQMTALGDKWTVLVGMLEDKPYEIFAIKTDQLDLSLTGCTGIIQRKSRGVYNFVGQRGDQQITLLDLASYMQTDDERADTRKYSLMLRHGVHPKYIVQQIDKAPGFITSFNKAVARTLKQYVSAEEQGKMVMRDCPQGGEGCHIVMQEGCATCQTCGKSKCS